MADTLVPQQKAYGALSKLKTRGLRLGLITNCGPDVPMLLDRSPFAQLIDVPVFSCEERVKRPSIGIYQAACRRLRVDPGECVSAGDGSGEELTGAAAAGMVPILKSADLSDVYDRHRPEVESWTGLRIDEVEDLTDLLSLS